MNTTPQTLRQACVGALLDVRTALVGAADATQSLVDAFEQAQTDGERSYVLNMAIRQVCNELLPALHVEHLASLQAKLVAVRK